MRSEFAALMALALVGAAPAPSYPAKVQADINELKSLCTDDGGRIAVGKSAVLTADLDGDGQADYVIDTNQFNCTGGPINPYGGSHGIGINIHLSSKGYAEVQGFLAFGAGIDTSRKPARLLVDEQARVWNGSAFVVPGAEATRATNATRNAAPARGAPASGREDWQIVKLNATQSYAQSRPVGFVESVLVECSRFGYRVSVGFRGHAPTQTIRAIFGIPSEPRVALTMERINNDLYAADIKEPYLYTMLTGPPSSILLTVDGRVAGNLSLAGSSRVVRTVLAKCRPAEESDVGPPAAPLEDPDDRQAERSAMDKPWTVGTMPDGAVYAQSAPFGQIRAVMALCVAGKFRVAVWAPERSGRSMNVEFVGPAAPIPARLYDQGGTLWSYDTRDSALVALLASEQPMSLRVEGQDMGAVPLDGANAALRRALAPCLRTPLPPPAPVVAPRRPLDRGEDRVADAPTVAIRVPMKPGLWVPEVNKCGAPSFVTRYDGGHLFSWLPEDAGYKESKFTSIKRVEPGLYAMQYIDTSEGGPDDSTAYLRIFSPTRVSLTYDDKVVLRWCAPEAVPSKFR